MSYFQKSNPLGSPTSSPPLSTLAEHFSSLSQIELNLNQLCSQHDSLMPLLSLLDVLPSLSKTSQTIKSYQKKIEDLEKQLEAERQVHHYNEMSSVEPQSISQINNVFLTIKECKESIKELEEITSSNRDSSVLFAEQPLPEGVEEHLTQHKRSVQYMLSECKNNIEMKYKNNHFNIILNKEYSKLIPSSLMEEYRQQINNIYREIQMVNMDMNTNSSSDIMEFHSFSSQRIEYELYEMRQIINVISEEKNYKNIAIIEEKIQMLYYQIKGLRKKYIVQFNQKAKEGKSIKAPVEQVKQDLQGLEDKWRETKKVFQKLNENYLFELSGNQTVKMKLEPSAN